MQKLTPQGQKKINELARRYRVSTEAVTTLLQALVNGNGTMAQFNHPDLGGSGQWMQGGMTMVSDMFNNALKATVDGLCAELSNLLITHPFRSHQSQTQNSQQQLQGHGETTQKVSLFVPGSSGSSNNWWPADLGVPSSTGSQNNVHYAIFPNTRRLAVDINGKIKVYDTLDHQISGVSQQQSTGASVTFSSQKGMVSVEQLPVLAGDDATAERPSQPPRQATPSSPPASQETDIFATIEKLAGLHDKGILTDAEFAEKKAELLSRL